MTLFQLWAYLEANSVRDLETHMSELATEGKDAHVEATDRGLAVMASPPTVHLVQSLASSEQDVIVQALKHPAECSLRNDGLHAVVKLLKDPRGKVSASASSVLRSLSVQPRRREQVNSEAVHG